MAEPAPPKPSTVGGILAIIAADDWRMRALSAVRALALPDCWIGAGFLRAAVWDRLHGFARATPLDDVDVVYFDPELATREADAAHERRLAEIWDGGAAPVPWQVRNQARMHLTKGDAPYADTADSLCHWLETPTAVAVRLTDRDRLELLAPLGIDDLLAMRVAPTPYARDKQAARYVARVTTKLWSRQWPRLETVLPPGFG